MNDNIEEDIPVNKLVLIDGNSIANRAFYALPLLNNDKGVYTNAVYGFAMMLMNVLEKKNLAMCSLHLMLEKQLSGIQHLKVIKADVKKPQVSYLNSFHSSENF